MRNKLYKILATSIMLAMVFTLSCSDDKDDDSPSTGGGGDIGGGSFNPNSQIYNKECNPNTKICHITTPYNGNGIIKIDYNGAIAGSVTNGIVNLQPPETIPQEMLRPYIGNEELLRSCSSYPPDIKIYRPNFILTDSNGDRIGSLGLYIDYDDGKFGEGVSYLYFSKAGKITCNYYYEDEWEGITEKSTHIYDIDAKAGWNIIYLHEDFTSGTNIRTEVEKSSTTNILTREMKWTLSNW